MARIRTIKPEFFTDEKIGSIEPLARLLFIGLWGIADGAGRFAFKPGFFKVTILPYDQCDIHALLATLTQHGFINQYSVAGIQYGCIPKFNTHQRISGKEASTESHIPPPPDQISPAFYSETACTGEAPEKHPGNTREATGKQWGSGGEAVDVQEGKGRERNGKERKGKESKSVLHTIIRTFTPPNQDQIAAYCLENNIQVDHQRFLDYYTANGWKVGRNPMKDWKAAVRNWHRNDQNKSTGGQNATIQSRHPIGSAQAFRPAQSPSKPLAEIDASAPVLHLPRTNGV